MIKSGNYISIQGFMVKDLGLKGNELLVYAIIYGFSQDGETHFTGSLQYLADWTNSTKQGVLKNLKSLLEKKLIQRVDVERNRVKFVEYYTTEFNEGIKQSLTGGIKQSLTNNIDIDNINKQEIKNKKQENLNKYGEFKNVCLEEDYYEKLKLTFGEENLNRAIDKLDAWLDNPKQSKQRNHNHRGYFKSDSWVWERKKTQSSGRKDWEDLVAAYGG